MNMTTTKQVNAAINWYPIHDSGKPPLQKTAREALKEALTVIACDCCDENNIDDFEEIALLIGYLDKGKKLKPLPLPGFAI